MIANIISTNNRKRKYNLFLKRINPSDKDLILDVGFSNKEYSEVDNFLEKKYPYPQHITALGVDKDDLFKLRYPLVKAVVYDGTFFPFDNCSFDIGWSNAVIEHVGDEERQILFLKEIFRTCKKAYITTPNRFFPIEVHTRMPFIHWLPKRIFDKLLSYTSKRWATGDYMHLLSYIKIKQMLYKAGIYSYEIHKNRLLGFTMDFSIVFQHE
ncbi:MAG: class I SAM-dependent methyltransferase [Tannerella sp.]|jgi:SAM-dependent methyltransferase|nr:class I SAM-dependent methyltransferase [Tannerella sp.]